jgi:hypothetical protein
VAADVRIRVQGSFAEREMTWMAGTAAGQDGKTQFIRVIAVLVTAIHV